MSSLFSRPACSTGPDSCPLGTDGCWLLLIDTLACQSPHTWGKGRTGLLLGFLLQSAIGPGVGTSGARSWFHISSSCKRKMLRVVSVRYQLRSNSHGQQGRSCGSDKATNSLRLSLGRGPREGNIGQRLLGVCSTTGKRLCWNIACPLGNMFSGAEFYLTVFRES